MKKCQPTAVMFGNKRWRMCSKYSNYRKNKMNVDAGTIDRIFPIEIFTIDITPMVKFV